jgi:hypothetical protein
MKEIINNIRKLKRIGILVDNEKRKLFFFQGNKENGMYLFQCGNFDFSFFSYYFSVCLSGVCLICYDVSTPFDLPEEYRFLAKFSKDSFHLYSNQIKSSIFFLCLYKNYFNQKSKIFKIPNIIVYKIFDLMLI